MIKMTEERLKERMEKTLTEDLKCENSDTKKVLAGLERNGISSTLLERAINRAWGKDTLVGSSPWFPRNPAHSQCVTTALVVNDFLGGRIERVEVRSFSERDYDLPPAEPGWHLYNILPDGTKLDFTGKQYSVNSPGRYFNFSNARTISRKELFELHPDVDRAYTRLKEKVIENCNEFNENHNRPSKITSKLASFFQRKSAV